MPFGVGALAPILREEYGLQRSQVGLATATIFVAVAVCSVPAGRVTDAIGVAWALAVSVLRLARPGGADSGRPRPGGGSRVEVRTSR